MAVALQLRPPQPLGFSAEAARALFSRFPSALDRDSGAVGRGDRYVAHGLAEDREAEARILGDYQPLVKKMARKAYATNKGFTQLDDLISAGNCGLLQAVRRYDPERGWFGAYAKLWIKNGISQQIRFDRWPRQIPDHVYKATLKMFRAARRPGGDRYLKPDGTPRWVFREPDDAEIARRMGVSIDWVRQLKVWVSNSDLSLDMPVGETGESSLGDFIRDDQGLWNTDRRDAWALRQSLVGALEILTTRERMIIMMRFGLGNKDEAQRTRHDVAKAFELSEERIRQIEMGAIEKIRDLWWGADSRFHWLGWEAFMRARSRKSRSRF